MSRIKICPTCRHPKTLADFVEENGTFPVCLSCNNRAVALTPLTPAAELALWERARHEVFLKVGTCTTCYLQNGIVGTQPCTCLLKAVFKALMRRFGYAGGGIGEAGEVSSHHAQNGIVYGRKDQEFKADVESLFKRVAALLDGGTSTFKYHNRVWRLYFLADASAPQIVRILRMPEGPASNGIVWHAVRRIEQSVARSAVLLKPYPLFPTRDYFSLKQAGGSMRPASPVEMNHSKQTPAMWMRHQ